MPLDTQKIATDVAQGNYGTSTSSAQGYSPAVQGAGLNLSSQESGMLDKAISEDQRAGGVLGSSLLQYQQQIAAARANKGVLASNFAQNLGQLKDRIAQQQFENRQKQATSGFVGATAQARGQIGLNQQVGQTLSDQEAQYINNLRQQNMAIATGRQAELASAQPLLAKEFARTAATKGEYGMKSDQGFFGKFAGAFGKDQTMHAELDRSKFTGDTELAKMASDFGIDINSGNFQNQVNDAMKQTLTMTANSVYDRTYDVMFDSGNGPQKVSEYTKSMAQTVMDDIFGALNVASVIAIPLTGAISIGVDLAGAAAGAAIESIGTAAAEAGATTMGDIMATEGVDLAASEMAGVSMSSAILDGAETAGIQVGMDAEAMSTNVGKMLGTLFSEQQLQGVSAATMKTAMEAAAKTFTTTVGEAGEEEALKAAALNAAQIISKGEMITEMAGASAEGAATAGATGAEAGVEGTAQTGAQTGWYAQQRAFTPVGMGSSAEGAGIGETTAAQGATQGAQQAAVQGGRLAQLGQRAGQAVRGTMQGAKQVGKTAIASPVKVVWRGAATMVKSNLAQALVIPPLVAQGIYDTVMKAQKAHGLSEDAMNKMAKMLADSYKQEQETQPFKQPTISAKKANQTTQRLGNK